MGLIVIDPGQCATVQDAGRPGYSRFGVPRGGAFDTFSADLANALVGNPSGAAVVELTLRGGEFEADCPLAMAIAGAPMPAMVYQADAAVRTLDPPTSFSLKAGQRLRLGRVTRGSRTYLAVRGGWQTPLVLGSRSLETFLKPGDVLPAQPGAVPIHRPRESLWTPPVDRPFRVLSGPDELGEHVLEALTSGPFRVGLYSNRMGLRLEGAPIVVAGDPSRLSSPVAPGAIQLAGDQLIVLGVARGTMGGYPHIAQVVTADLDRLGQLAPGDELVFERVSLNEARMLDRECREQHRSALTRITTATRPGG